MLALGNYGYVNARPAKTQGGIAEVTVYGLTDLGRRVLRDSIVKLKIDSKEQEQVLGQIYLMSVAQGGSPTQASFRPDAIAEKLQMGVEEVERALRFLDSRGLAKRTAVGEANYLLTEKGMDAVLQLLEGHSFRQVIMGDQYYIPGQAGAVGPGARAEGNTFQQIQQQAAAVDPAQLQQELASLLEHLKAYKDDPDKEDDLASIELARKAAERGDATKAFERLAKVGGWVKDFAIQAGAQFTAEYLKKLAGI